MASKPVADIALFRRGRRPNLTGIALVDLARLPLNPEVLDSFKVELTKVDPLAAASRALARILERKMD